MAAALRIDTATYVAGALAVLTALIVGILSYAWLSGWGAVYKFSDIPDTRARTYIPIGTTSLIYNPRSGTQPSAITIYLRETPTVFLSVHKTDYEINIEWKYPQSMWADIKEREGEDFAEGKEEVITSRYSILPIPYVRNLTIKIPEGTLSPLITRIVSYGAERGNLDMDRRDIAGLVSTLRELLLRDVGIERGYKRVTDSALWAGEVQFLTLVVFVFFLVLKMIGVLTNRLNEICEYALETLPYIGFFGTLLGMGQALELLGSADVTNATRKAVSLGPIGSQMGLAVQTTMFAIILYLAGGFIGRLLDLVSEDLREQTGADEPREA